MKKATNLVCRSHFYDMFCNIFLRHIKKGLIAGAKKPGFPKGKPGLRKISSSSSRNYCLKITIRFQSLFEGYS